MIQKLYEAQFVVNFCILLIAGNHRGEKDNAVLEMVIRVPTLHAKKKRFGFFHQNNVILMLI